MPFERPPDDRQILFAMLCFRYALGKDAVRRNSHSKLANVRLRHYLSALW